ncbi:unnamed protein product [Candidula unifasciata]|uniref:Uncharacterized protein n=1 Tax=Candidula unifasciata TaxID=100452 RepID=A0A8S4A987_9EUPU|nr:unnamed protein product [Candidula unifasciata]
MFPLKTLLVLVTLLTTSLLLQTVSSSPVFATYLDQKTRQDILTLADRIAKLAQYGGRFLGEYQKRNGGTLDALYNMPDLEEAGR